MIPTLSSPIPIDLYQFARHFIRRSWTLSGLQAAEVTKLEIMLLEQWKACYRESHESLLVSFSWGDFKLVPRLLGIISDHGIHQKVLGKDSPENDVANVLQHFQSRDFVLS
jgi:hypothetical protein